VRALLAIVAVTATACAGSPTAPSSLPPTPASVTLQSSAWATISDPQPYALANDGSALVFEFPAAGSMNYLYTPSPLSTIRGTLSVTVRVTTTGPVIFQSLDQGSCGLPSSVRPFIWANDNGNGDLDRWWSNPYGFNLAAGTATIAVPLSPESWSSVNGQFGNASSFTRFGFEKALLNVTRLGLTFGGGCSFGHGIKVSGGTATFAVTEYGIR
jgi:hypothetical protein